MSSVRGPTMRGEALPQAGDDGGGFVHRQGRLGDVGDVLGVLDLELVHVLLALDEHDPLGGLPHRAFDLLVAVVADEHDRVAVVGEADGLAVDLRDQRAGGVDRAAGGARSRPRGRSGPRRGPRTRTPPPRAPRCARPRRSPRAPAGPPRRACCGRSPCGRRPARRGSRSARSTVWTARSTPAQ